MITLLQHQSPAHISSGTTGCGACNNFSIRALGEVNGNINEQPSMT